jgi:6-phosphogluconolactonase
LKREIKLFQDDDLLIRHLTSEIEQVSVQANDHHRQVHIALSGGNTPNTFFGYLAKNEIRDKIKWNNLHFYWGDERCVPPEHPESNYGMAKKTLLDTINIKASQIHRIRGELDPAEALKEYDQTIRSNIPSSSDDVPRFDWIFLGLGNDGHTASIFPNSKIRKHGSTICAVATQPKTGQRRITLQMKVINNARRVSFLVTGKSKAKVVAKVLGDAANYDSYPATRINLKDGILEWYLDEAAASHLNLQF